MSETTTPERDLWAKVLTTRVERFGKLVALRAPDYVIATDLMLLIKAVAGFAPQALGQAMGEYMQEAAREGLSLCVLCGQFNTRSMAGAENWCQACEDEARKECEEDDAREAAEGDR
jgi:hypothetical protein